VRGESGGMKEGTREKVRGAVCMVTRIELNKTCISLQYIFRP
jgi:hypothetical protein